MKYSIVLLCAALLCVALALAGCSDALAPTVPHKSGVEITVSSDTANQRTVQRTLFPNTDFTKYVLSFSGPGSHADITLTGGNTTATVIDLANGLWTVTVVGWVTINGTQYPAAQGSAQVNVASGTFQSVDVTIRASMEGAKGVFSYSVSLPPTKVMDSAGLQIYPYDSNEWYEESRNLKDVPSGTIELDPGYYMMIIQLRNDYQTAGHTEVVYICSHMETEARYTFTDADFTDTITISGTVNVKVNGQDPQNVFLRVYLDEDYNYEMAGTWINVSNGTWSMQLAGFDTETSLYFKVEAFYNDHSFHKGIVNHGVTVTNVNQSGINLGAVNISVITLSGTLNVTCGGNPVPEVYIRAVDPHWNEIGSIQLSSPGANAPWSITIQSFDTPTNITFLVYGHAFGTSFDQVFQNLATGVTNQNRTGIAINLGNFPSPVAGATSLAANTWKNGNITVSDTVDWYSINVTTGTTYYFWWNDSFEGNSTRTLDVDVYAFSSNGDHIFDRDSAWDNPAQLTADSSGTVYLRVRAYNGGSDTGTYQIVYRTNNSSRPNF